MRNFALGFLSALLLIAAVGAFASLRAQEWWAVGSGIALHLDGSNHCNNYFTKGVGVERKASESWRLALGYYDNSNCRDSFYGAATYTPLHAGSFHAGVIGGFVTGYRSKVLMLPVGGFAVTYEGIKYGLNFIFIPPTGDSGKGVGWLQWKMKF